MIYKECYDTDYANGTLTIEIYTPDDPEQIIYFFGPSEEIDLPYELLDEKKTACVSIMGMDWNRDLTPWPAPALVSRAGSEEFSGEADEFLKELYVGVIPEAEEVLNGMVDTPETFDGKRMVSGISLGGLFALYSMYRTDLFVGGAMISASMWYDGFMDFMKKYHIYKEVKRAVFLVGGKEKNTRDTRMAAVENCTREAAGLLRSQGVKVDFEIVPGGHFVNVEDRIQKAFGKVFD